MSMTITMLQTRMGESGSLLTAGSSYTVSDAFGGAMIGAGYATAPNRTPALSPGVAPPPLRVCFFGDSITQRFTRLGQNVTTPSPGGFTTGYTIMWAEPLCGLANTATRNGTLTYAAATRTLTWQAPLADTPSGDTVGAPVDASKTGLLYVPSGTAGMGLWIQWFGSRGGLTSGSVSVGIAVNGSQLWGGVTNSPVCTAMAMTGDKFQRATLPSSCPPGMDGCYGIGGANTEDLLAAYWQWGSIQSDVDVLQIGTNDVAASVAAATIIDNIKAIVACRVRAGVSLVVVETILPRSESAANRAIKSYIARALFDWAATQGGRVVVSDVASSVTDAATGSWVTSSSGDAIHPSSLGGLLMGAYRARILNQLAPAQSVLTRSVQDAYDATNNPKGNLIATLGYSNMAGTGGTGTVVPAYGAGAVVLGRPVIANGNLYVCTVAGTAAAAPSHSFGTASPDGVVTWLYIGAAVGGVATGWTTARSTGTGSFINGAKVTRTDGVAGTWQAICCWAPSGAAATEIDRLIASAAISTGVAASVGYDASCEIVIAARKGMNNLDVKMNFNGTGAMAAQLIGAQGVDTYGDSNVAELPMVCRLPPGFVASSVSTTIQPSVEVRFDASATACYAVILVGRIGVNRA
jgi:hypothetical protein